MGIKWWWDYQRHKDDKLYIVLEHEMFGNNFIVLKTPDGDHGSFIEDIVNPLVDILNQHTQMKDVVKARERFSDKSNKGIWEKFHWLSV